MGYSEFNPKENSLIIFSGSKIQSNKFDFVKIHKEDGFELVKDASLTVGIKVDRFLSNVELKGIRGEMLFKELLDQISIPYLHIGQSPGDHSLLLQEAKSKRPDFLVNIPQLGILLFDVKCRRKMGFPNTKEKYFQVNLDEISRLGRLQKKLLLPVWVAFLDEGQIYHIHDKKKTKCTFYLAPVEDILRFGEEIRKAVSERRYSMISSIRIPDELLSPFAGDLNLRFGIEKLPPATIQKFAKGYNLLFEKTERELLEYIKTNKIYKTYCSDALKEKCWFALKNEIDHILGILIKEKQVVYKPNEFLRINLKP
jgi:hypothetical protein